MANNNVSIEVFSDALCPHLVSNGWVVTRNKVRKYQSFYAGACGDPPNVLGLRMTR